MEFQFTAEEWFYIFNVFGKYEKKFETNLYGAWIFNMVDWLGMAKAAEKAIESGNPLTNEEVSEFHKYDFPTNSCPC